MWRWVLVSVLLCYATSATARIACDGIDDHLTTPAMSVGTTATLAGWIFPQVYENWSAILATANCTDGWYERSWTRQMDYATAGGSLFNTTPFCENVWHHFAVVITGGTGVWYVDGVVDGTVTGLAGFTASEVCNDPCGEVLHGMLAELQVFPSALSDGEVAALAASQMHYVALSRAPSVYWVFDQCGDGATGEAIGFVDRSGNGHTLTADNGANNTGLACGGTLAYPWGAN